MAEVIEPIGLDLNTIVIGTPTYTYNAYAPSTFYAAGSRVRYDPGSGYRDFECRRGHTSPSAGFLDFNWTALGASSFTAGSTEESDMAVSLYPAWTSGAAVAATQIVYDAGDHCDYQASAAITSGDNTIRPSDCVVSSDETIAARWYRLGPSNLYALLDGETATVTLGLSSANTILNPATVTIKLGGTATNLVTDPHDFSGWTVGSATLATNQAQGPDSDGNTADKLTSSGANAYINRSFTGLPAGARLAVGLWLKSTNIPNSYFQAWDTDTPATLLFTSYLPITGSWNYYNFSGTVPASGKVTFSIGGGNTIGSGDVLYLWGAHFSLNTNYVDRIGVFGLKNCDKIGVYVQQDAGAYHQIGEQSATPSATAYGTCVSSLNQPMSTPFFATDGSLLTLMLYPKNLAAPVECGLVYAGQAVPFGATEWGVSVEHLSYSRKERDTTFGTVTFQPRGSAKRLRAVAYLDDGADGDVLNALLKKWDGRAVVWDFNASDTDYDRLRVFGFHSQATSVLAGTSWQTLALDVESLMEF